MCFHAVQRRFGRNSFAIVRNGVRMKYTENYVYMYGQMISTCSFLLDGDFPKADGTAEIKEKYHLVGGETGGCSLQSECACKAWGYSPWKRQ